MRKRFRQLRRDSLKHLKRICIVSAIDIAVTLMICYFAGYRSYAVISDAIGISALVMISLGICSICGSIMFRQNFSYQYLRTATSMDANRRREDDSDAITKSVFFALFMAISAAIPGGICFIMKLF